MRHRLRSWLLNRLWSHRFWRLLKLSIWEWISRDWLWLRGQACKDIFLRLNCLKLRLCLLLWNLFSRGYRERVCSLMRVTSTFKHFKKVEFTFCFLRFVDLSEKFIWIVLSFFNWFQVIKLLEILYSMLFNLSQ